MPIWEKQAAELLGLQTKPLPVLVVQLLVEVVQPVQGARLQVGQDAARLVQAA